jgi:uncharacterized protein (DUF488 family)
LLQKVTAMTASTIWTIGHSNQPIEQFLQSLDESSIAALADVRRFPGSRRHPQFSQENLRQSLAEANIAYHHFPALGGRRTRRSANSVNTAWRVEAFAAYADYMQTDEFRDALGELEDLARRHRAAIMCAEALPWRCHRRLIADALIAHDWSVFDIFGPGTVKPHSLTEFARIQEGGVVYPGEYLFSDQENE